MKKRRENTRNEGRKLEEMDQKQVLVLRLFFSLSLCRSVVPRSFAESTVEDAIKIRDRRKCSQGKKEGENRGKKEEKKGRGGPPFSSLSLYLSLPSTSLCFCRHRVSDKVRRKVEQGSAILSKHTNERARKKGHF